MIPIFGYMHVMSNNAGLAIHADQMTSLGRSGLFFDTQRIDIGVLTPTLEDAAEVTFGKTVYHYSQGYEQFEFYTLRHLYNFCCRVSKETPCYVWYVHTKGAFSLKKNPAGITHWRRQMEDTVIHNYQQCIDKLNEGYGCVGSHVKRDGDNLYFPGNFWWARSDYIASLCSPDEWIQLSGRKIGRAHV